MELVSASDGMANRTCNIKSNLRWRQDPQ